jgi:hypothetical protein
MPAEYARAYIGCWAAACVAAMVLAARYGRRFAIARREYWRGVVRPWKLLTFAVAFAGIVLVAPRSGDPTWDYWDAGFMAVLTYVTAPWTLGVVVRALKRQLRDRVEIYVAACAWLFSASFSYDLYIFLRDHHYPSSWSANIVASSALYAAGGAMWSLRWERGVGTSFAFLRDPWPGTLADGEARGLWPFVLLFMGVVVVLLAPFLWMAVH